MTPEDIKSIVEKTLSGSIKYYWIYLSASFFIGILLTIGVEFFKTKGQNLATKQDIEEITKKVEQVKAEIQKGQEVEKQKRELKYKSLLTSLNLIDAYLSHVLLPPDGQEVKKQYATTEEARTCHNNLILTCENTKVLELFSLIMFGPKLKNSPPVPLTDLLNQYRNLVRQELGFGNDLVLDRERLGLEKPISKNKLSSHFTSFSVINSFLPLLVSHSQNKKLNLSGQAAVVSLTNSPSQRN